MAAEEEDFVAMENLGAAVEEQRQQGMGRREELRFRLYHWRDIGSRPCYSAQTRRG